jgi:hypothetical protein
MLFVAFFLLYLPLETRPRIPFKQISPFPCCTAKLANRVCGVVKEDLNLPVQAPCIHNVLGQCCLLLSKILSHSPARDLRLGAFGGAFRVYMSILC